MKTTRVLILGLSVFLLLLGALPAGATVVETFSSTATITVKLPGTVTAKGIEFEGTAVLGSIDFASGTSRAAGIDIDLDGEEGDYTALGYEGTVFVPAQSGPATVRVTGSGNLVDLQTAAACPANFAIPEVNLAQGFSEENLAGDISSAIDLDIVFVGSAPTGSLSASELSDREISVSGSVTVVNLDGANGVVDLSALGSVRATETSSATESSTETTNDGGGQDVPIPFRPSQASGLGLMVLGLGGLGRGLYRRWRA